MKLFSIFKTKTLNERTQAKIRKKNIRTRKKSAVGDIYLVHPSHVVHRNDMPNYAASKNNRVNKRPVAVVKQTKDKKVEISQIYGTPGRSGQVKNGLRVPLSKTKTPKRSWIETEQKRKSEKTGRAFKIGESPLNNSKKGKVASSDLKRRTQVKNKKSHI